MSSWQATLSGDKLIKKKKRKGRGVNELIRWFAFAFNFLSCQECCCWKYVFVSYRRCLRCKWDEGCGAYGRVSAFMWLKGYYGAKCMQTNSVNFFCCFSSVSVPLGSTTAPNFSVSQRKSSREGRAHETLQEKNNKSSSKPLLWRCGR